MRYRSKIITDWAIAVIFFIFIMTMLVVPGVGEVRSVVSNANLLINILTGVLFGLIFIALLLYLFFKDKNKTSSYFWLTGTFLIYFVVLNMTDTAWDRFHLVEYGILSLLLFRALRHSIATKMLYVWSFVIVLIFALLDETLQLFVTNRGFELSDLGLDCLSAFAGMLLVATVIRPELKTVNFKIRRYANEFKKGKRFSGECRK